MIYTNNGKKYAVESVTYGGACIQVNGTTITNQQLLNLLLTNKCLDKEDYSVFVDGDELAFNTFEEAYEFATTKQKDTFRI